MGRPTTAQEVERLLAEFPNNQKGEKCSVGQSGESELVEALHAAGMQASKIAQVMGSREDKRPKGKAYIRVGPDAVRRHVRGMCRCRK